MGAIGFGGAISLAIGSFQFSISRANISRFQGSSYVRAGDCNSLNVMVDISRCVFKDTYSSVNSSQGSKILYTKVCKIQNVTGNSFGSASIGGAFGMIIGSYALSLSFGLQSIGLGTSRCEIGHTSIFNTSALVRDSSFENAKAEMATSSGIALVLFAILW